MRYRRRHGPFAIFALLALLIALNMALVILQYLAELLPLLLVLGVGFGAWRVRQRRIGRQYPPRVIIVSRAVDEDARMDRGELARLRDDNAKLRTKVRVLSDMLNGEPRNES